MGDYILDYIYTYMDTEFRVLMQPSRVRFLRLSVFFLRDTTTVYQLCSGQL